MAACEVWNEPIPGEPEPGSLNGYDYMAREQWAKRHYRCGHQPPDARELGGEERRLYCLPCYRRKLREGFTEADWQELNAKAAREVRGHGRYLTLPFPKLPVAPKPRRESARTAVARMRETIAKLAAADVKLRAESWIGKSCGPGWILTATDEHIALMEPGDGPVPSSAFQKRLATLPGWFVEMSSDFHLALKRNRVAAPDRSEALYLTLRRAADLSSTELHVEARNPYEGMSSREIVKVSTHGDVPLDTEYCFSAKYLDLMCGQWPLYWYPSDERGNTGPVRALNHNHFVSATGEFRLVLMPMRV